jgi:hypothetical protein
MGLGAILGAMTSVGLIGGAIKGAVDRSRAKKETYANAVRKIWSPFTKEQIGRVKVDTPSPFETAISGAYKGAQAGLGLALAYNEAIKGGDLVKAEAIKQDAALKGIDVTQTPIQGNVSTSPFL